MRELAPSILSANFYDLKSDFTILKEKNIKYLHLDVMDGMFVQNISFGIPVIKKIKENISNDFILDTHLMIVDPEKYIEEFYKAGADIITFHYEATKDVLKCINMIKNLGIKAGISINPDTDINSINEFLPHLDLVLVMSVFPGFGGQKFIEDSIEKLVFLKNKKIENNFSYIIEIDGGINKDNIENVAKNGAELIVAGSAVFNGNIKNNIESLLNF